MGGVAVAVADQIVISGTGESLSMVRHVVDEYIAPVQFQRGFLTVVGELAAGLLHHAVQRRDISDIVAVYRVYGNAMF
jgi:hypothetical protein